MPGKQNGRARLREPGRRFYWSWLRLTGAVAAVGAVVAAILVATVVRAAFAATLAAAASAATGDRGCRAGKRQRARGKGSNSGQGPKRFLKHGITHFLVDEVRQAFEPDRKTDRLIPNDRIVRPRPNLRQRVRLESLTYGCGIRSTSCSAECDGGSRCDRPRERSSIGDCSPCRRVARQRSTPWRNRSMGSDPRCGRAEWFAARLAGSNRTPCARRRSSRSFQVQPACDNDSRRRRRPGRAFCSSNRHRPP